MGSTRAPDVYHIGREGRETEKTGGDRTPKVLSIAGGEKWQINEVMANRSKRS